MRQAVVIQKNPLAKRVALFKPAPPCLVGEGQRPEVEAALRRSAFEQMYQPGAGAPFFSYAYLLDTPDGTIAFDTGVRGSGPEILAAAGGAIVKIVLSHAHADHRGGALELGAPIYCHPDEVADAQAPWQRRTSRPVSPPLRASPPVRQLEHRAGPRLDPQAGHLPAHQHLARPFDHLAGSIESQLEAAAAFGED